MKLKYYFAKINTKDWKELISCMCLYIILNSNLSKTHISEYVFKTRTNTCLLMCNKSWDWQFQTRKETKRIEIQLLFSHIVKYIVYIHVQITFFYLLYFFPLYIKNHLIIFQIRKSRDEINFLVFLKIFQWCFFYIIF